MGRDGVTMNETEHNDIDYIKELLIHIDKVEHLLYRAMHCLQNDYVPGPKFAALWQEYFDLTGIHEGDVYPETTSD